MKNSVGTYAAFKGLLREGAILFPLFYLAILASRLIQQYADPGVLQTLFQDNWLIAIPALAVILSIIPLPRYIDYPIAAALFGLGAGYGVVFVLLSGEAVGDLIRNITEAKFLGWRFAKARILISIVVVTLGGFLMEVLL